MRHQKMLQDSQAACASATKTIEESKKQLEKSKETHAQAKTALEELKDLAARVDDLKNSAGWSKMSYMIQEQRLQSAVREWERFIVSRVFRVPRGCSFASLARCATNCQGNAARAKHYFETYQLLAQVADGAFVAYSGELLTTIGTILRSGIGLGLFDLPSTLLVGDEASAAAVFDHILSELLTDDSEHTYADMIDNADREAITASFVPFREEFIDTASGVQEKKAIQLLVNTCLLLKPLALPVLAVLKVYRAAVLPTHLDKFQPPQHCQWNIAVGIKGAA